MERVQTGQERKGQRREPVMTRGRRRRRPRAVTEAGLQHLLSMDSDPWIPPSTKGTAHYHEDEWTTVHRVLTIESSTKHALNVAVVMVLVPKSYPTLMTPLGL